MRKGKKDITHKIILLLIFVLILEIIPLATKASMNIKYSTDNWGLGYKEKGIQPSGNDSAESLKRYNAYYVGEPNEKIIYLTFDAGYENGYTDKLLEVLKKHEVPATFFLVAHYIKSNPELVKRMVDEGHIIGNHTYSHPDMTSISKEECKKELEGLELVYKELIGSDMKKYYRPPAGKYNKENLETISSLGYKTIFWSLAYVDWDNNKQPSKEHAFSKLLPRIHPGAIVLLHSNSKTNSEILDELIIEWKKDGYIFKSLDELFN